METNKNLKKIVILGMILLIIAGLIVVLLKGFHVSLLFGKHEAIELKLGVDVDTNKVKEICTEVFENKKFVVKELEVFGDSVQINVESATDEEKEKLVNKINEGFGIEKTVDDLKVNSISNKRIRDVLKPYISPLLISVGIIFVYMLIRFRKSNSIKFVGKVIGKIVLLEALLLSIIAIARIPVNDLVINILVLISVADLINFIMNKEKELEEKEI